MVMGTRTRGRHLGVLTEAAMEKQGDAETVWFAGHWYRAAELLDTTRRVTGGLRGLGITPSDRVVVLMANSPEVGVTYSAIWRAGGVVTPVVFLVTEAELRHVLADSGAAAVVTSPEFLPTVLGAAAGVPTVRQVVLVGADPAVRDRSGGRPGGGPAVVPFDVLSAADPAEVTARADDDLGALMYTGGTTGRAKGVMLSHGNLFSCAMSAYQKGREINDIVRTLVPLPLSHAFGMIITVIGACREEPASKAVLMRWFDPTGWLRLVQEHRIESSPVVPAMVSLLLQQPLDDYDLSSLRYLPCGSAPLAPAVMAEWERRVPSSMLLNGYGCTESGAVITSSLPSGRRPGTVGTPIRDYEVRIVDDAGAPLPAGADGEICARGPGLMRGYWHAPEATATTLVDGWLHTGDIGHLDGDGFLTIVDRTKDLIIRGGFNVFPRDVEDVLLAHPAVAAAGVVGRPDPVRGEEVVAFVALRPGVVATAAELVSYAKDRIAATKYPREVHVIDAVPLTSIGKTDRKALRARLAAPDPAPAAERGGQEDARPGDGGFAGRA